MIYRCSLVLIFGLTLAGCYSFKGISIPPDVTTFYVAPVVLRDPAAPADYQVQFAERLRDKVRNESRLKYNESNPDIEFESAVTNFRVVPVAVKPGESAAINRLEVSVEVKYISNKQEKDNWTQTFKHFADFSASENLLNVQTSLLNLINTQLTEDIFNKAFTNW